LPTPTPPIKVGHGGAYLSSMLHKKYKKKDCGPGQPDPISKITKAKNARDVVQVIESLSG
jgi:hypothetical protein